MSEPIAVTIRAVPTVVSTTEGPKAVKVTAQLKGEPGPAGPEGKAGEVTKVEAEVIAEAKTKSEREAREAAEALKAPLASPTFTGAVTVPTPSGPNSAVSASYVQANAAGIEAHPNVLYATTEALPANTYLAGVLTGTAFGALSIDGGGPGVGERVHVKNEVNAVNNGFYVVTHAGAVAEKWVLTRATDMGDGTTVKSGAYATATAGTTNKGHSFWLIGEGPFTVGTSLLQFERYYGAREYVEGKTGTITITGDELDVSPSVVTGSANYVIGKTLTEIEAKAAAALPANAVYGYTLISPSGGLADIGIGEVP